MIKFLRYCGIGFINLFVCLGVMVAFEALGAHYVLYTFLGYAVAFLVSFALNFRYTFGVSDQKSRRFMRFMIINPLNLLMVEIIQIILIEKLKVVEPLAVFIGMSYYTLTGFFLNQRYVFAREIKQ